jgi:CPA2 family monovalent cation:H+ antiporter-2
MTHRSQLEDLRKLGVHELVQPEFEAGLELARQTLLHFDVPATDMQRLANEIHHASYQLLTALL